MPHFHYCLVVFITVKITFVHSVYELVILYPTPVLSYRSSEPLSKVLGFDSSRGTQILSLSYDSNSDSFFHPFIVLPVCYSSFAKPGLHCKPR